MLKDIAKVVLLKPLYNSLIFLVAILPGQSVGLAIIVLTILIRIVLIKPSLQAVKMQQKMAALAPELQKVRHQHPGDKSAEAKATLELYRIHQINPAGSCLPLLIQLPIFIIFYHVLRIGLTTDRFDLLYSFTPRPDSINVYFLGFDLTKPDPWLLPVIVGLAQFYQSWQLTKGGPKPKADDPGQLIQKQMLYLMPIMVAFITRSLPAALGLYWLVTTLFSIAQQTLVFQKPALLKQLSQGVEVTVRKKN